MSLCASASRRLLLSSSHASGCAAGSRRLLHASAALARGSKGLDWYVRALRRADAEASRAEPPVFPVAPLHNRKRARAYVDLAFGAPDDAGTPPPPQRVVFELADDIVPITVANFLTLCARPAGSGYVGSEVFRVIKGFALFAGDWTSGDGRGGHSSFGAKYFPDENFIGRHTAPGVLAMASYGVHSVGSVFYVTLAKAPHLDGRCVVFGQALTGWDTLARAGATMTVNLKPATPIRILGAGQLVEGSPEWAAVDAEVARTAKAAAAKEERAAAAAAAKARPPTAGAAAEGKVGAAAGGKKAAAPAPAQLTQPAQAAR